MLTSKPVALITGASSGLGAVFATKLAARGYDLILVARRTEKLKIFNNAEIISADLGTRQGTDAVVAAIERNPQLELLVNNAGFGTKGRFWETDLAGQEQMHQLHIMAVMRLTRAALAGMVPRNKGAVINVSSVAAFGTSEGNVSYCATKAWMNNFTLGLDVELRALKSPVKVQALCPGFTITEFHDTMGVSRSPIPGFLWLKADDVVEASLSGLNRNNPILVPTWKYKFVVACMKLLPGSITRSARPSLGKRV